MGAGSGRTDGEVATAAGDGWRVLFWIVFARSANPMALLTLDRRFLAINRAGVTALGCSRDEIVGRRIEAVLVPDEPDSVDAEWRALEQRGAFDGERSVLIPNGQRVVLQHAMRRVRLDDHREVVLDVLLDASLEPLTARPASSWQASILSPREVEIVSHVAMGQRAREIADELEIAESTVKTHLRNAMRKVGARSQAHLVALVMCGQIPIAAVPSVTYVGR